MTKPSGLENEQKLPGEFCRPRHHKRKTKNISREKSIERTSSLIRENGNWLRQLANTNQTTLIQHFQEIYQNKKDLISSDQIRWLEYSLALFNLLNDDIISLIKEITDTFNHFLLNQQYWWSSNEKRRFVESRYFILSLIKCHRTRRMRSLTLVSYWSFEMSLKIMGMHSLISLNSNIVLLFENMFNNKFEYHWNSMMNKHTEYWSICSLKNNMWILQCLIKRLRPKQIHHIHCWR